MSKFKVLVVDDSLFYRKVISEAVIDTQMVESIITASNGLLALERLSQSDFDIVLLDVNMPELNGIDTLREIKHLYPHLDVIMISSQGGKNAKSTIESLQIGALDFILKPEELDHEKNVATIKTHLHTLFSQIKLKELNGSNKKVVSNPIQEFKSPTLISESKKSPISSVDMILIASSTGGPSALETIISKIDKDMHTPMLIVQHMPSGFTRVLAENLCKKCPIPIAEATDKMVLKNNNILIAPGGYHMLLSNSDNNKEIRLEVSDYVNGVRPSADVLFKSIAKNFKGYKILVVVLTGMGNDGTDGVAALKNSTECYCITQSEKTCVVYGMPRSIFDAGLSDEVLDIQYISTRIQELTKGRC